MSEDFSFEKLTDAVIYNDLQLIQRWLNVHDVHDLLKTNESSLIPGRQCLLLIAAINYNRTEIAELLINSGFQMKRKIVSNIEMFLVKAVKNDNIEITTMLLAKIDANGISENDYVSPLLNKAVENRSIDMLKLLLHNNANVNYINYQGITVLQLCFENLFQDDAANQINDEKIIDIVKLLLLHGASTNFRSVNGQTALHYAVRFGHKDVLHTILQKTDNVNAISLSNETPLHILLLNDNNSEEDILDTIDLFVLKGARVDIPSYDNETACHIAARKKYIKVLYNLLLQCQSDINFCDIECCTVLHRILEDSNIFSGRDDYNNLVNVIILTEPFCNIKNQHGNTPLHIAAENKHHEILYNMLFRVQNLNIPDNNGDTVLHIFLRNLDKNDFENGMNIITNLLIQGSNVDIANRMRQTPIHLALELRNIKLLSLVLKYSNDLNNIYPNQGWSILHIFSTSKCSSKEYNMEMSEIAEMCIKKGATVDLKDVNFETPLALAVSNKNVAMVKILLQYGANANARFKHNKTIMDNLLATNSEADVEIAEILLAHGMEVDGLRQSIEILDSRLQGDLLMTLVTHMKDVAKCNAFENTMLHAVLEKDKFSNNDEEHLSKLVSMLLSKGVPVDARTVQLKTALHLAVQHKHNIVTKMLLEHGANPKSLCYNDNSALHLISMQNTDTGTNVEEEIIGMIIEKGCLINARNELGLTPFLLAAKNGSAAVLKALLKHNAYVHCTVGKYSNSALHLAASRNNENVIGLIVQSGVDIHAQRRDGKTALHLAAAGEQSKVTKALLDNGADPDMRDNDGRTALHIACWNNSLDNVSCLLEYGADVNVIDKFQAVPIMLAQNSEGMIQEQLIYHLKKLEMVQMYISPLNQEFIRKSRSPVEILALVLVMIKEVTDMSQIYIDKSTPLYHVLKMNCTRLCALKNNKKFQLLINTNFLKLKFPHIADLIKGHYRKGMIRNKFLSLAKISMRIMLGLELPDICCKKIFMHLSNENLQKLITAGRLACRKRKRSNKIVDNNVQSKKVKC